MPYYHVLTTTTTEPAKLRCIATDLSQCTLKKTIIRPYKRGKSILVEGRIYPASELRSIEVIQTKHDAELTLDAATYETNQELTKMGMTTFSGYGIDDIAEHGEKVTHKFISAPPGDGGVLRMFQRMLGHPLVAAIFTAVLGGLATVLATVFSTQIQTFFNSPSQPTSQPAGYAAPAAAPAPPSPAGLRAPPPGR